MTEQRLIDQFNKNSIEKIKVHLQKYRGEKYLDLRVWVQSNAGENGGEIATRKGLTLHVELIPDLIKALQKAEKAIQIKPVEATGKAIS